MPWPWPKNSPEVNAWWAMHNRCRNPNNASWHRYGGRGIRVCDEWTGEENGLARFLADMGPKPTPEHSLDRIDNDGNYEPTNCRWATPKEQSNNKSNNVSRIGTVWAPLPNHPRYAELMAARQQHDC